MTDIALTFTLLAGAFVLCCAWVPNRAFAVLSPAFGASCVGLLAPYSLIWILCLIAAAQLAFKWARAPHRRSQATALVVVPALGSLLLLREVDWLTALGAAYFCLRTTHLMLDWWMEKYAAPRLAGLIQYMLFLPVFLIGPINRYPEFQRAMDRRRYSGADVLEGAERVLIGLFMAVVIGGWAIDAVSFRWANRLFEPGSFLDDWLASAIGWVDLYFVFAGLSSVAIGVSLMAGLRISENFNHPYLARSLVEFWSRWHISLTQWCRDYIYSPIANWTRRPVLGVFAAMLVLGIWHESSLFYMGWAAWQALGIVLSRVLEPVYAGLPRRLDQAISPVLILGWLSLANPIIPRLLERVS